MHMVQRLLSLSHSWLLTSPSFLALTEEERALVVRNWAGGKRHVLFSLRLKMSFWFQLPWCLFALAHPDEATARASMRRALALYATAGDGANHHWLTMLMCCPGSALHDQLLQFSLGNLQMSQAPLLQRFAARFRFAPVTERWVEGEHALSLIHI